MARSVLKKQMPTLLGLLILFIGAGAGVLLVGTGGGFLPRAGPEYDPRNLQITNVSDRSFSVSWTTDEATVGYLRYGESPSLSTTITDDRDQLSGDTGSFRMHHVTIRGLKPSTTYYFKIGSGSGQSLYDNQGQPYQVTTGPTLGSPSGSDTLFGKVVTSVQTPAEGSIVYVQIPNGAPLSTLVKASGSWAVSLASARTDNLSTYLEYDPETTVVSLEVGGEDGSLATGQTSIDKENPVPTITLGENFNFVKQSAQQTQSAANQQNPSNGFNLDELEDTATLVEPTEVEILNPSYDGESVNSTQPEIQGQAPPNTTLNITIHSDQVYEGEVVVDASGNFSWTPAGDLEPGEHTITLSWLDANGIEQFFTRNFVVLAQGESNIPAFESTPSATPTPTPAGGTVPSPTPTPTLKPTATPTPSPTLSTTPSATPTSTPRVSQPSSASGIPVAGSAKQSLVLIAAGFSFVMSGFFLSRRFE